MVFRETFIANEPREDAFPDLIELSKLDMPFLPVLDREDERELIKVVQKGNSARRMNEKGVEHDIYSNWIENGNEARKKLILHSIRFIGKRVSDEFGHLQLPYLDMVHEGGLGLSEAIDRFDLRKENRLITYAASWIDKSVRDYVRTMSRSFIPTRHESMLMRKVFQAEEFLWRENQRSFAPEEVAEHLGWSQIRLAYVYNMMKGATSMDAEDSNGHSLHDKLPSSRDERPVELSALGGILTGNNLDFLREELKRKHYGINLERDLEMIMIAFGIEFDGMDEIEKRILYAHRVRLSEEGYSIVRVEEVYKHRGIYLGTKEIYRRGLSRIYLALRKVVDGR